MEKLEQIQEGKMLNVTIVLDDPSGNSYLQVNFFHFDFHLFYFLIFVIPFLNLVFQILFPELALKQDIELAYLLHLLPFVVVAL
jgi:hypothetical protein